MDYLAAVGMDKVAAHEHALTAYALERPAHGARACGSSARRRPRCAAARSASPSATLHPHDVGQVLDEQGVAVRVGHHCARPVCKRYGVTATTRASFHLYTTFDEVDALVDGLETVRRFFA